VQSFTSHVNGYYDVADQLPHLLRRDAEHALAQQLAHKASLASVAQFEARREQVRASFLDAIGGLSEEKTPLNAQCTGIVEGQGYVIEKLIYESLPGFHVTAALYVPGGLTTPAPAVIFVHGHWDLGKAAPEYQAVCIELVRQGFVVLAVDPPGQGERKQYYDPASGELCIPHCTDEHTYSGLQFVLGGASLARHFIWDVIRGVDLLESRSEVDTARIGITGNSGGGTQTSFLMMAEPRLAAAVPCTFIMTLETYMNTGQPQDSEQIVRGCFVDGPDHDDYLTMMAPKPVLVGAATYDFFPLEGTLEAVRRAQAIYRLYDAEEKIALVTAPTRHTYSAQLRAAAVQWFCMHLQGATPKVYTDAVETLRPEQLWCTPKGQVLDRYPDSRTVFDLNRSWVRSHAPRPKPLHSVAEFAAHVARMRQAIPQVLGIDLSGRNTPIYSRVVWEGEADGYLTEQIFFFSEADMAVTGVLVHPQAQALQTDIVLLAGGTNGIRQQKERLRAMLDANHAVFVFDPRGLGAVQTRAVNHNSPPHDTEYKLGCDAMMLKRSTLGMRVLDVLRAYDYLCSRPDVEKIGIAGVDSGAFFAYFAAALEDGITDLVFENLLFSYENWVETRLYDGDRFNLTVAAWGILRHFDLVDLLPCFAGRDLTFRNLRNAKGEIQANDKFLKIAIDNHYLPESWMPKFWHDDTSR
jgi:dienelactone hydrolase